MNINKTIKLKIDNVPAVITVKKVDNSNSILTDKMLSNLGFESELEEDMTQIINESEDPKFKKEFDKKDDLSNVSNTVSNAPPVATQVVGQNPKDPSQSLNSIGTELAQMQDPKMWYKSRTIWVNVGVIVASLVAYLGLPITIPAGFWEMLPVLLGIINIVLRKTTTEPVKFTNLKQDSSTSNQ